MYKFLLTTSFISAIVPGSTALAASNDAIREVRLSSGGLAEITRTAQTDASGDIHLNVPLDQVNDILKSLVLNNAPAHGLSLLGPEPLQDRLKGMPFNADALSSVPTLLSSIPGAAVSVSSGGKTVTGKVLGIETRPGKDGQSVYLLSVLTEQAAVETLELDRDASLTLQDTALRDKLASAVKAVDQARDDRSRTLRINAGDATNRSVSLSYVVASPIWKTAYRIVLDGKGKARLQAWTVLENASGEDWHDVAITLTSAEPVTLAQRLHQRYWRDRPDIPVDTAAQYVPEADTGNLGNRTQTMAKNASGPGRPRMMAPPAPAPMAEAAVADIAPAPPSPAATATESDISATYALPGRHNVANGDTLSVPIVDTDINANMVSLYRAGSSTAHPVAAVMLENSSKTSLPPGILTIYDGANGYAGDAQLAGLPSGDTRLASFAVDRKVTVTSDRKPREEITDIKLVDGLLQASQKHRITTTYTVTGALDGDRTVVIEHPVRSGWEFSSPQADGRTASHFRLKADVAAGKQQTLTVEEEQLTRQRYAITDISSHMLASWSAATTDKGLTGKLKEFAAARAAQADAERDLSRLDEQQSRLEASQERIRQNLSSVPDGSDLGKRYLKQLEDSENAIDDLANKQQAARETLVKREEETIKL